MNALKVKAILDACHYDMQGEMGGSERRQFTGAQCFGRLSVAKREVSDKARRCCYGCDQVHWK